MCAAGELFLSGVSGLKRQPMLPEAAATDGLAGAELLFGPMPGGQPRTSDADAWQVLCVLPMSLSICDGHGAGKVLASEQAILARRGTSSQPPQPITELLRIMMQRHALSMENLAEGVILKVKSWTASDFAKSSIGGFPEPSS